LQGFSRSAVIASPRGERSLPTTVDAIGMGAAVNGYNDALAGLTAGLYKNFGMDHMPKTQI